MQRCGAKSAQRFEVIRCAIALVVRESVLRIQLIKFFHPLIALDFREDRSRRNRNRASVSMDDRFLFDGQIELDSVEQEKIGQRLKLGNCRNHRLSAGLVNVPGIYAARVDFGDGPRQSMFVNARSKFSAAFGSELLGIVETYDAAPRIENDGSCYNRTE